MIEVRDLCKSFGSSSVLRELSFKIERGSFTSFIGPNGAGKSTLFRILLGLVEKSRGSVIIDGSEMKHPGWSIELKKRMGFSPENLYIHGHLTGREFLQFVARIKGDSFSKVDEMLDRFQLTLAAHRKVATYSKGMKQRLVLAQALLGAPDLLFLDEPTGGLDPRGTLDFYDILGELKSKGVTVVMNSHFLEEIETRMDRVGILIGGKLVAFSSPSQLIQSSGLKESITVQFKSIEKGQIPERFQSRAKQLEDHSFLISCSRDEKLELMKEISSRGSELQDFQLIVPSLSDVYHSYLRGADL